MGSTSGISEQAAVSRDDNHQPAGEPDGLLPYSSAGNAVPPHCVPYGRDFSRRVRHARIRKLKKNKKHTGQVGKHKTVLSPQLKEPQKVQFVLSPSRTTNYTPHPSLSNEKPTENCILSAMELPCLCSFLSSLRSDLWCAQCCYTS